MKNAARDLVLNCRVNLRDVPKVWATCYAGIVGEPPDEKVLFTRGNLADWIVELGSAELQAQMEAFWAVREKYPGTVLHVHHDATTRKAFEIGSDAKLMLYIASYFNPDENKAVSFILSMRALPGGGSAAATARGLVVCLADMGLYTVKSSPDPATAFQVALTEKGKGVLDDLGSDNTGSALNVALEMSQLTGEVHDEYPCPTHMNALDGKNPLDAAFGRQSGDATVASYDRPITINVPAKVFYVYSKHKATWETEWRHLQLEPSFDKLMAPPNGQPGKWETMGPAFQYVVTHAAALRKLMVRIEYVTTNMDGYGSLKKDAGLLWRWLCDPDLFFSVLAANSWFNNHVEPVYQFLYSPSKIHSASGGHFKREEMPLLALKKLHMCRTFSGVDALDKNISWTLAKAVDCAKTLIPDALQMLDNAKPRDEGVDAGRFVVHTKERDELLMDWAKGYCKALNLNWQNHWSKFLEPPLLFGLATDPEIGAAFVRRFIAIVAPAPIKARAGTPEQLQLSTTASSDRPAAATLDRYMFEHMGHGAQVANIKACVCKYKLDTAACMVEWLKLADPAQRLSVDWTRATLPALASFFEGKFFGGMHSQLMLEQKFSVYGQHASAEQGIALKEAIVAANVRLGSEREARRAESMRAKPLSAESRAKLPPEQQKTGELQRSEDNRKQLVLMTEQLLKRSEALTKEGLKSGAAFAKKRKTNWEMLALREAKAANGERVAKRQAGRAVMTTDPFSTLRGEKRRLKESAYQAQAEAEADDSSEESEEEATGRKYPRCR